MVFKLRLKCKGKRTFGIEWAFIMKYNVKMHAALKREDAHSAKMYTIPNPRGI